MLVPTKTGLLPALLEDRLRAMKTGKSGFHNIGRLEGAGARPGLGPGGKKITDTLNRIDWIRSGLDDAFIQEWPK